jgi:hypothetical protein
VREQLALGPRDLVAMFPKISPGSYYIGMAVGIVVGICLGLALAAWLH